MGAKPKRDGAGLSGALNQTDQRDQTNKTDKQILIADGELRYASYSTDWPCRKSACSSARKNC